MIPMLKAEFRKLFTVRSTYVILLISLVLEGIFAFYVPAFQTTAKDVMSPTFLASEVTDAIGALGLICAIAGILLVTHEYRYNTIMYSLTNSKSRLRVLTAKFLTVSVFAIVYGVLFGMLAPLLAKIGVGVHGLTLAPQTFDTWNLLWRSVFACWGFSMLALILAAVIRIQVGAIVAVFLVPSTVESLLGLLLKHNQVYLPFTSLSVLLGAGPQGATLSHGHAALVGLAYIVVGFVVTAILFQRRDAN